MTFYKQKLQLLKGDQSDLFMNLTIVKYQKQHTFLVIQQIYRGSVNGYRSRVKGIMENERGGKKSNRVLLG